MKDERAGVKLSTSPGVFPDRPLLRMLVSDRVRGSAGLCHPLPPRLTAMLVEPTSECLKVFVPKALLRIASDRIDMLRLMLPLVEGEERLDLMLRSLRLEPVRSEDFVGETLPVGLGVKRERKWLAVANCHSRLFRFEFS